MEKENEKEKTIPVYFKLPIGVNNKLRDLQYLMRTSKILSVREVVCKTIDEVYERVSEKAKEKK